MLSLVVLDSADEVYRVEVCALCEHLHVLLVVLVNLARLEDLQRDGAVLVVGEERAAARLADVLDDAANTHGTIELLAQINDQLFVGQTVNVGTTAEGELNKVLDLLELEVVEVVLVQLLQVLEHQLLQLYEHAGNHLLIVDSIGLQTVGYDVVDVLDEDDVGINLVQVFNQGAVTAGTEEQRTVFVAEGLVVGACGDGVGRRLLLGERDVVLHAVLLGILVDLLCDALLEHIHVLVGDGEVDIGLAVGCGIECALDEVLLHRRARTFGIVVEQEHALRQLAVVQAFLEEHVLDHLLILSVLDEVVNRLALVLAAGCVKGVVEGKLLESLEELLLEWGGGYVVVGVDKCEHILEHARCGTTGGYELHNLVALLLVVVPSLDVGLLVLFAGGYDAVLDTSGCL